MGKSSEQGQLARTATVHGDLYGCLQAQGASTEGNACYTASQGFPCIMSKEVSGFSDFLLIFKVREIPHGPKSRFGFATDEKCIFRDKILTRN